MAEYYAEQKYTDYRFDFNSGDLCENDISAAVYLGDLNEEELEVWKQHLGDIEQIVEQPEVWTLEYRSPLWTLEDLFHPVVVISKHTIDNSSLHVKTMLQRRLNIYSDPTLKSEFPKELINVLEYCKRCADEIHAVNKSIPPDGVTTIENFGKSSMTVDEKLTLFLCKNNSYDGSASSLAKLIGCSHTAVGKSPSWKAFIGIREEAKKEMKEKYQDNQ